MNPMNARLLLIETSCSPGLVAVALKDRLLGVRRLQEARRHARDLAPTACELLNKQGWKAHELHAVVVGIGPGSYTGLRVGIMTAKALAYATGCAIVGIETFAIIARQAPARAARVDVIADAQQGKVYVQRFARVSGVVVPLGSLAIRPFDDWLAGLEAGAWVTGPAVHLYEDRLQAWPLVESEYRQPIADSLLALGLERLARGDKDDFWKLEPLYLRPSNAEEKWRERKD
jgi:tRNA threonylcarbamoyladenosine biosynthesis protein TsaB